MAATLKSLGEEKGVARRIAVLGPMRELGPESEALHAALAPAVLAARVDRLILIGPDMAPLADALDDRLAVECARDVDEAQERLLDAAGPGDAVLVKASNSVGLGRLVERITQR